MRSKNSTYWRFQIIGWTIFFLLLVVMNLLGKDLLNTPFKIIYFVPLLVSIEGLFVSHLMREAIKRLGIISKSYLTQAFFIIVSTLVFSMVLTTLLVISVTVFQLEHYYNEEARNRMTFFYKMVSTGGTTTLVLLVWNLVYYMYHYIQNIRQKAKAETLYEKELLKLEAKALRAQMNPHFVFNSMNSIKSLINKNENDAAANYLTTFSKLIRTLFQNSDKREVSLYEEVETCKLYTQLEKMRFGDKVQFIFDIDEAIDVKNFKVPALILQPFIENAIWHGLIHKETGGSVKISVKKSNGAVQCIIDDNGIGRMQSKQYKPQFEATYSSKGIGLTQSRLELDKLLNDREEAISIIDKEDGNGKPGGTKVIITFKENRN